jgi:hypothetical protein
VSATEQLDVHIPVLFIASEAGQQGPVALVQELPSQDTAADGAIAGGAHFGSVAA